ncbi:MAG: NAD(+)/NADH kinase [Actinomycetota bacterium]
MRRAGFVIHPYRPAATEVGHRLAAWLEEREIETRWFHDEGSEDPEAVTAFAAGLDLILSLGGDGTFLRAAHVASHGGCPVLGVKVGRVGFLTEVEPEDAPEVLERAIAGTARIEERLAVVADPYDSRVEPQWALNEIIVEKGVRHRLVHLALYVDDAYVTALSADGVIVATPTGSTAYSFSAGGPIVTPTIRCLLVTPVAAHMVFDRSLVLSASEKVTLEVIGDEGGVLSADGRASLDLPVGARVRIGAAPNPALLLRRNDAPAFHTLVRRKFGLPGEDPSNSD